MVCGRLKQNTIKDNANTETGLQMEYAALDAACLLMLLDNIMACAPPYLTTNTSELALEPGNDAEPQHDSSQAWATGSHVCLQGSQQQQVAEPESSEPPGRVSAAQTDSTAATGAKSLSDADSASSGGDDAADNGASVNTSSGSSQHVEDDKPQSNAAAANSASCSSSKHSSNDRLQNNTAAAGGNNSTSAGAAAGVQQASRVLQQKHQQKHSQPSSIAQQTCSQQIKTSQATQQTGSQQCELSKFIQQTGSQLRGQAIQQKWQDQSGHQAAILQAIEQWACQLEMSAAGKASKARARRHLSRRQRAHIRHAMEEQNQIDDAAGQLLCRKHCLSLYCELVSF